jgi:hypothetical protein
MQWLASVELGGELDVEVKRCGDGEFPGLFKSKTGDSVELKPWDFDE